MVVQTSVPDEEAPLPLQVETDHIALSQDVAAPWTSRRLVWTGLGFAGLMLFGVSACALHPLGSSPWSDFSRLTPEQEQVPLAVAGEPKANAQCNKLPPGYCDVMFGSFCPRECEQRRLLLQTFAAANGPPKPALPVDQEPKSAWMKLSKSSTASEPKSASAVQQAPKSSSAKAQCSRLPKGYCDSLANAFCPRECEQRRAELAANGPPTTYTAIEPKPKFEPKTKVQCSTLPQGYCDAMYNAFCPRECELRRSQLSDNAWSNHLTPIAGSRVSEVQESSSIVAAIANPRNGRCNIDTIPKHCDTVFWAFCPKECQKRADELDHVATNHLEQKKRADQVQA